MPILLFLFALSLNSFALPPDLSTYVELAAVHKLSDRQNLKSSGEYVAYINALISEGASKKDLDLAYLGLANEYVKESLPQEAVWYLRKAGFMREASLLLNELKEFLTNAALDIPGYRAGRATTYALRPNFSGIVKEDDATFEVFAYELSERLGLGFVPLTILRELNRRTVSLQIFIKPAVRHEEYSGEVNYRDQGYPANRNELFFFDFLINNSDRHGWNHLLLNSDFLVAIDHGHSLKHYTSANFAYPLKPDRLPSLSLAKAIMTLPEESLRGIVDDTSFEHFLSQLRELRGFLKTHMPEAVDCRASLEANAA